MIHPPIDMTHIPSRAAEEKTGRYETTVLGHGSGSVATEFVMLQDAVPVLEGTQSCTPFSSDPSSQARVVHAGRAPAAAQDADPLAALNDARIRLIDGVQGGQATTEDAARLKLLTERMRLLAPRVTKACVDEIAHSIDTLEELQGDLEQIKTEFGLP